MTNTFIFSIKDSLKKDQHGGMFGSIHLIFQNMYFIFIFIPKLLNIVSLFLQAYLYDVDYYTTRQMVFWLIVVLRDVEYVRNFSSRM